MEHCLDCLQTVTSVVCTTYRLWLENAVDPCFEIAGMNSVGVLRTLDNSLRRGTDLYHPSSSCGNRIIYPLMTDRSGILPCIARYHWRTV